MSPETLFGTYWHHLTLCFFFKFISRTNNSKSYAPTYYVAQETKNVALEKIFEQITLKPCDF